jgi:hypothetical protein
MIEDVGLTRTVFLGRRVADGRLATACRPLTCQLATKPGGHSHKPVEQRILERAAMSYDIYIKEMEQRPTEQRPTEQQPTEQ